jgi:hypothetical protein
MSDQSSQHIPNESSREIRIFAIVISILAHIIFLYLPLPNINIMLSIRTPGIQGGAKGNLLLIRKSEIRGNSNTLAIGDQNFGLTLEKLQIKDRSPKKLNNNFLPSSEHLKQSQMSSSRQPSILSHKVQGKDVTLPHGALFSEKSRHAFDGSLFDVGLVLPEGIGEDQLNRMEEVFYSFRKRTFEQFINQILFLATTMNSTYPLSSFPWTSKKNQVLRAKLTYDREGNLLRIMHIHKSDAVILQDFYQKILNGMSKIPNPPRASIKENGTFELTVGIRIL